METRENVHFLDKVASALRKAAIELEEFQVQLSLGKATASDKFEELKKELNRFIDENKSKASETKDKIQTTLDELRVQLALGKAETLDAFREQKKKLLALIHEIETKIKNGSLDTRLLFLQGKPIDEPVAQYGPFVMNSQKEIMEAMDDYRRTEFGGWPWPSHDNVHEKSKGKFALYPDGKEITPS